MSGQRGEGSDEEAPRALRVAPPRHGQRVPAAVDPFADDGNHAGPARGLEDAKDNLREDVVPDDVHVPKVAEAQHAGEDAVAWVVVVAAGGVRRAGGEEGMRTLRILKFGCCITHRSCCR